MVQVMRQDRDDGIRNMGAIMLAQRLLPASYWPVDKPSKFDRLPCLEVGTRVALTCCTP